MLIIKGLSFKHWLCSFFIMITGLSINAWKWKIVASSLGIKVSFSVFWSCYFIGNYFNLFLPGTITGDIVRGYLISRKGFNKIKVGYSIIGERAFGLLALILISLVGSCFISDIFPEYLKKIIWPVGLAFIFVFSFFPYWTNVIIHLFDPLKNKIPPELFCFWKSNVFFKSTAAGVLFQISLSLINYILAREIGIDICFYFFLVAIPIVSLITILPITIQGIGLREGAFIYVLSLVNIYSEKAIALSLLYFSIVIAVGVIGGIIYILEIQNIRLTRGCVKKESF